MVRKIIFGGICTGDYKAPVDGSETYGGPERDYEAVPVPGRNGDLTVDNGRYINVDVPYTIYFRSSDDLELFRAEILALTGYQRLEDSKRPEEYRMARLKEFSPSVNGVNNRHGAVSVVFDCMPQRFLKSGEQPVTVTSETSLHNRWGTEAKPLIRVYGAGRIIVGGSALIIQTHGCEYMDIDCELGDAYCNGENLNGYVEKEGARFPALGPGETKITLEGPDQAIIYPRWWKL